MRYYLRYCGIFLSFVKTSAMADLEYRMNLAMKIFTDVIWYTAQLSVFEVLFSKTSNISGWDLGSIRVFMGVLFLVDAFWMLLFSENLDRLSEKVRRGDLDLLLVKPVNSQFMISLQKTSIAYVINIVLTFAWLTYSLSQLAHPVSLFKLFFLLFLIPGALAITYSLRFFFSACALIFTRADNINFIWYQFYRLGCRPDSIYPKWLRYLVLSAVPVAFIASVPARILLDEPDFLLLFCSGFFAVFFVYLSTRFWQFSLKFYSSASS